MRFGPFHCMLAVSVAIASTGVVLGLRARLGSRADGLADSSRTAPPPRPAGGAGGAPTPRPGLAVERSIPPPLPVAPRFGAAVSGSPKLEWRLAEHTDGARVELCPTNDFDGATTRHLDVDGEEVGLPPPWPPGVWYWRLRGISGSDVGQRATPTWMVYVSEGRGDGKGPQAAALPADAPTAKAEPTNPPQLPPPDDEEAEPDWYARVAALIDQARSGQTSRE